MARAQAQDYLHSMRFYVNVSSVAAGATLHLNEEPGGPQAGFSAVSVPEATVEAVEYKEGQWLYTRKYPGMPTYSDVTMSRGVAKTSTNFWSWIRRVIEGTEEYRVELDILHFSRADTLPGYQSAAPQENLNITTPSRVYRLYNAFPTRHKLAADLDGTDSAVSIMELDVAYEYAVLMDGTYKEVQ